MLEHQLQREDYCMKTLRTVYPYVLNERTKFMNKDIRLFPPLQDFSHHFQDMVNALLTPEHSPK